jgi:hypothetical protein
MLVDFLKNKIEGALFGFVFDRGCFHSFSSENDRKRFAQNVATHLEEAGLWLTIVGNADEHRQGPGSTSTDCRRYSFGRGALF